MAGHDWERLHEALGLATTAWSRDELVGLLKDLIREYVIERGLPTGSAEQAATPELSGFDFPQLITWLKNNLELPELALFQVDGRRVLVDADGPRELVAQAARVPAARAPTPRSATPRPAQRPPIAPPSPRARPAAATLPARPTPPPVSEPEPSAPAKPLSRGFRGLEFD